MLISPDLILTAAHCVYSKNKPGYAKYDFRFYHGQHGLLERYYEIDDFYVPKKYNKKRATVNDYAILKLKEKVETDDFIPLSGNMHEITNDVNVTISGYPGEAFQSASISGGKKKIATQLGITKAGKILNVKKSRGELIHRISSKRGHSGAPIILEDKNKHLKIVGVHFGNKIAHVNGLKMKVNAGRLVTPALIE